MGYSRFKISVSLWWQGWKVTHLKKIHDCDLPDLYRKRSFHRYMTFTYLSYVVVSLGMIIEMYLQEQGDIVINTMLLLVMLALYDTKNEINYIDRYIYDKLKENGL